MKPDPQLAGIAADRLGERGARRRRPGGVTGLVAREDVQRRGGLRDRPAQRAVGRQEGVAELGAAGDPPAARLQADEAAARGRDPDRAAAVARVRDGHHPGCDRRPGAARGAARRAAGVPRVARRPEAARLGDRDDAELGRGGAADEDEPGLAQAPHDVAVVVGREVLVQVGAVRERPAGHRHAQVLDRDRHARERPLVPARDGVGGREGAVGVGEGEGVDLAVDLVDPPERLLDELARADVTGSDELGKLGYRAEQKVAHGDVTSLTGTGAFSRMAATRCASSANPIRSSTSWPSAR